MPISEPGKREIRQHVCPYCMKRDGNLNRHLIRKHADSADVALAINFSNPVANETEEKKKSRLTEKTRLFNRIRKKGAWLWNQKVLEKGYYSITFFSYISD